MLLLLLFALIAGAGTALSPCVVPVLPAILAGGVTGGRRRPFGIATGLIEDPYGWLTPVPSRARAESRTRGKVPKERVDSMSASPI